VDWPNLREAAAPPSSVMKSRPHGAHARPLRSSGTTPAQGHQSLCVIGFSSKDGVRPSPGRIPMLSDQLSAMRRVNARSTTIDGREKC
jgi:hypothetical protein